jgi:hypothetical protein
MMPEIVSSEVLVLMNMVTPDELEDDEEFKGSLPH